MKILSGANWNIQDFNIGEATNSRAAVLQTDGAFTAANGVKIGNGTTSYGYYSLSGGTLANTGNDLGVGMGSGATGVMDVSGGSVTTSSWLVLGRNGAGNGLLNVTGGSVTSSSNKIALNWANTSGSISILNVGGGAGAATVTGVADGAQGLELGASNTSGTAAVANLRTNGTLTVSRVFASNATPTALVNFNGGTLKATATNAGANFMNSGNIDAVTVYSGGGTIHNNGTNITVGNVLGAATGNGVTSIAVTDGGSGYIGAPLVKITGGTGNLATGYAVMADDGTGNGTFRVSSIVITSPGTFSVNPDTVTLTGGGATTAATIGAITMGANTSGGMTFAGTGTTTLTNTNTYTGATSVQAGTLKVAVGGTLNSSTGISVSSGATVENANGASITAALALAEGAAATTSAASSAFAPTSLTLSGSLSDGWAAVALTNTAGSGLTKGGALTLTLSGITAGTYNLTSGSGFSGAFSSANINGNGLTASGSDWTGTNIGGFDFTYINSTNELSVLAVPEPSALGMLLAGLGTLVAFQRRRRHA